MVTNPTWQCFIACWGDKYSSADINHLIGKISASATSRPRFVLLTDCDHPDLLSTVVVRRFPDFYMQPDKRKGGCLAKLAMFQEGVMPDDLPAIYVDIDTAVFGDLSKAFEFQSVTDTIQMIQSAIVPFSAFARWMYKITNHKRYARGNSSVLVFHPAKCHFIDTEFRRLYAKYDGVGIRNMHADERFISWIAQPMMRRLPNSFAVKFPTEFMLHTKWLCYFKSYLPWVRRRRQSLVAITYCDESNKFEVLLAKPNNEVTVDRKGRVLIWNDRVLSGMGQRTIDYYRPTDVP
jgi:hypothetical protein